MKLISVCEHKSFNYLNDEIINLFPKAYTNYEYMIKVCETEIKNDKSGYCNIPISETLFSETLGRIVSVSRRDNTLKSSNYKYDNIKDMYENIKFDDNNKALNESLKLCKTLSEKNIKYILNISGVMSTLDSLIDITKVLKATKKDKESLKNLFEKLEDFLIEYIKKFLSRGAKFISYSDPLFMKDILGISRSSWIAENFIVSFFYRIKEIMPADTIIHICPKTIQVLEELDIIRINDVYINIEDKLYYNETVEKLRYKLDFVGGMCINSRKKVKTIKNIEFI